MESCCEEISSLSLVKECKELEEVIGTDTLTKF